MRSCGNFVVIWFHCKFLHSWMVNFQEGIYWTDRAFNSAWANTLPFCLVTKLAKEKEKEKKIITTSNSLRILTQWKMFTSNFHSSWIWKLYFLYRKKSLKIRSAFFLLLKNELIMYCCCLYTNVLCWDTRASNFVRYNAVRSMYKLISC